MYKVRKKIIQIFYMAHRCIFIYISYMYLHSNEIVIKLLLPENPLEIAFVNAKLPWSARIIVWLINWNVPSTVESF